MQNLDIHFIHAQRRRNLHGLIITRDGAERASRDHSDAIFEIQQIFSPPLLEYSSRFPSFLIPFLIFRDYVKLNRILAQKKKREDTNAESIQSDVHTERRIETERL